MLVLAALSKTSDEYKNDPMLQRLGHMRIAPSKSGWVASLGRTYTGGLSYAVVFAFGMASVGVGAILLIVGLTTAAGKP